MEGLLDHSLRDVITQVGGVDRCVSEFIRITDQLLPERVFTRIVPELLNGGRTAAGVPVRPQLLGSDPDCLADNAARLATLGPEGVDLNFGCPAKTVNRHRGGDWPVRAPAPATEPRDQAVRGRRLRDAPASASRSCRSSPGQPRRVARAPIHL